MGTNHRSDELPKELTRREGRLQRIQQPQKALEAESKAAAEQARTERKVASKNDKRWRPFFFLWRYSGRSVGQEAI